MPAKNVRARREGAAYTIAEECERLFCGTLHAVFLGEGNLALKDSLAMGAHNFDDGTTQQNTRMSGYTPLATPPEDESALFENSGLVEHWVEVWDYAGGIRFRGFVATREHKRMLFIFFDDNVLAHDLKPGYASDTGSDVDVRSSKLTRYSLMALLELCSVPAFNCSQLIACLDRRLPTNEMRGLSRDLGWVGFEPVTLAEWTDSSDVVSTRWLLFGIET